MHDSSNMTGAEDNPRQRMPGLLIHDAGIYDFLVWLVTLGREKSFRERLLGFAHLDRGETVLDIGCGTGSLAIAAKRAVGPDGSVYAVDASPEMLDRAKRKTRRMGLEIDFRYGVAQALQFPDTHCDVVLCTLMLHHLARKARADCTREIHRVLKPGGRALVIDFTIPARKEGGLLGRFHKHGYVKFDEIVAMLSDAGLKAKERGEVGFRSLQYVLAERPA